jgi:preprotein translocase subunit SecE
MSREGKRRAKREEARTADLPSAAQEAGTQEKAGLAQFLREVRSELRKVAWPDRQEVTSYSIVVLVTSFVLIMIVWGMDFVIREAVVNTLG